MQEALAGQAWDLTLSDSDSEPNDICNIGEECDEEQVSKEQEDGLDGLDPPPPDDEPLSLPTFDRNQFWLNYCPQQLWRDDETATLSQAPRQETWGSRDRNPYDRPCHHHSWCSDTGFEEMMRWEPRAPAQVLPRTQEWVHHQPPLLSHQEEYTATYGFGVLPTTGNWLQQPGHPSRQENAAMYGRGVLPTMGNWLQQPSYPSRQEENSATYGHGLVDFLRVEQEEAPRSPEIDLTQAEYPCNDSPPPLMLSAGQLECAVQHHQYAITLLRTIQVQRESQTSHSHQSPPMPFVGHPARVLSGMHVAGFNRPPALDLGFGRGHCRGRCRRRMPYVLREFGVDRGRRRLHHADRDFGN